MNYLFRSFVFNRFIQVQSFKFSKKQKGFDLESVIASHKSKDGLDEEIKKYENNLKLEEIQISLKDIVIPKEQLEIKYSRSSGAGGQHVNKTNTKAEIRFNVDNANWINDEVKKKLKSNYAQYLTQDNYFILTSQQGRDQENNLKDTMDKLRQMIWECSVPEKSRVNLIPAETVDLQRKRIDVKRKKSEVKSTRSIR